MIHNPKGLTCVLHENRTHAHSSTLCQVAYSLFHESFLVLTQHTSEAYDDDNGSTSPRATGSEPFQVEQAVLLVEFGG